jgi:hybrid cluster-associated redox disulfide protein
MLWSTSNLIIGGNNMSKITPDMIISEVLSMDRGTAPIFLNNGMHCLGCPSSSGESIEDACAIHGIDAQKLVKELNEYFAKKEQA